MAKSLVTSFTICMGTAILLKKYFNTGWSKTFRCKARAIMRNEAYYRVRRNNERKAQRSR